MVAFTVILAALTVLLFIMYQNFHDEWMQAAAITMLTIFYHFAMRLTVGETITVLFRSREFPQNRMGFSMLGFEVDLYRKWHVQRWKKQALTAKPELFDLKKVSPEELLHNMMQAELVHRIIMILSFVPLFFIIPFGTPVVFIITSVLACLIDFRYVIIQRYNRPRAIRYIALMESRQHRRKSA